MSITVNGATNTITAASGLAIAGNTAVTGALSATGVTSLAAGAVGAPGLYLGADTTTGLYRIGANNYGVAVSGAKVLDIASTGLAVTGAVTSDSFKKGDTGNFVVGGGAGGATYLDSGAATDINIRPGGSSIAGTFSSTGLAVTGTLSYGTGTGATAGLKMIQGSSGLASGYGTIYPENATPFSTNWAFATRYDAAYTALNAATSLEFVIANVNKASITTSALTLGTGVNLVMASGQYIEGGEGTAPAAPAANGFRIFAEDNGAGKTRLMVQFATGAAQQLAIEP
jgi:hypothetical protein